MECMQQILWKLTQWNPHQQPLEELSVTSKIFSLIPTSGLWSRPIKYSYGCCLCITYHVTSVLHIMWLPLFCIVFKAVCIIWCHKHHREVMVFSPIRNELPMNVALSEIYFYALGLTGPLGASSNWIVRLSVHLLVHLFICPSFCNSVPHTNKVQYLKSEWWYSNQTWTVSSSMGSPHCTDIRCPLGWAGSKCRT